MQEVKTVKWTGRQTLPCAASTDNSATATEVQEVNEENCYQTREVIIRIAEPRDSPAMHAIEEECNGFWNGPDLEVDFYHSLPW